MSQFDPGRKPPISQSTNVYNDYNISRQNDLETIILTVIPNDSNCVDQIACIILSSDGTEKESFSFKNMNQVFDNQADYLHDRLNDAQWFITEEYDIQQILDNSYKTISKFAPRPSKIINATQYFNDYKINENKFNSVFAAKNARIGMLLS